MARGFHIQSGVCLGRLALCFEAIDYFTLLHAFEVALSTWFRKKKKKKNKAEEVVETVEKVEAKVSKTTDNRTPAQIAYDKVQEQRVSSVWFRV